MLHELCVYFMNVYACIHIKQMNGKPWQRTLFVGHGDSCNVYMYTYI